jgi:hypothetical protein
MPGLNILKGLRFCSNGLSTVQLFDDGLSKISKEEVLYFGISTNLGNSSTVLRNRYGFANVFLPVHKSMG